MPLIEINGFFGNIGIPDQHVLGEPQIGPKYAESKKVFSKVVYMFFVDMLHIPHPDQYVKDNDQQGCSACQHARKYIPAIEGAEPMGVDRHEPVPGAYHTGKGIEYDKNSRQRPQTVKIFHFAIHIYFQGCLPDIVGQYGPCDDSYQEADIKERLVQIGGFFQQNGIQMVFMCPFEYEMQASQNKKQQEQQTANRYKSCHGLSDPGDTDMPSRLGYGMNRDEKQTNKAHAQEVVVIEQQIGCNAFS